MLALAIGLLGLAALIVVLVRLARARRRLDWIDPRKEWKE